ncbi:MAG: hypothetical protein WAM23_15545, partial [Candidatus Acidiferrales bacterium]
MITPEIRRGRIEFNTQLVKASGFLASRPNDASANSKTRFLAVNQQYGALDPVDRGENQSPVNIYHCRHDLQGLPARVDYQRYGRQDARASSMLFAGRHFDRSGNTNGRTAAFRSITFCQSLSKGNEQL